MLLDGYMHVSFAETNKILKNNALFIQALFNCGVPAVKVAPYVSAA